MNKPKITVSKYKHCHSGMEGDAFSCDMAVDGVLCASVSNDGNGGPNFYQWKDNPKARDARKLVNAYVASLPLDMRFGPPGIQPNLDCVLYNTMRDAQEQKRLARLCRTKTLFRLNGDPQGLWRYVNRPYDAAVKQHIMTRYGDKVEIANEGF